MKSIVSNDKVCFFCKDNFNLEKHHILHGTANRQHSEDDGLWVYLCQKHHRFVHDHPQRLMDLKLCMVAQSKYEETHTREEFLKRYKRSWL